jgi:hypothetical protein
MCDESNTLALSIRMAHFLIRVNGVTGIAIHVVE